MSTLAETYRAHADRAMADADAATLENVRERSLRAASAWSQMADREARTERSRAARTPKADPAEIA